MDRSESRASSEGGVSLDHHDLCAASAETPIQITCHTYCEVTGHEEFPLHDSTFRKDKEQDVKGALGAKLHKARIEQRVTSVGSPAALAALILSGAADEKEPKQYISRHRTGNTSAKQLDSVPQYYEPSRQITRKSRAASLVPTPGRHQRTIASIPRTPSTMGNAVAFVDINMKDPQFYLHIGMGFLPTVEQVLAEPPFFEPCFAAAPNSASVLRITNMPYALPRSGVSKFIGDKVQILAQPPGTPYQAVHVITDPYTGKTIDTFVEFSEKSDVDRVLEQWNKKVATRRYLKLGNRPVSLSASNQQDLMDELFPRAKSAFFVDGSPRIIEADEWYYLNAKAAGFSGFLQSEEIVHMIRHAEFPARVNTLSSPLLLALTANIFQVPI
nr:hypothetical protein CFP56_53335 [Quercus suber]